MKTFESTKQGFYWRNKVRLVSVVMSAVFTHLFPRQRIPERLMVERITVAIRSYV